MSSKSREEVDSGVRKVGHHFLPCLHCASGRAVVFHLMCGVFVVRILWGICVLLQVVSGTGRSRRVSVRKRSETVGETDKQVGIKFVLCSCCFSEVC